MDRYVARICWNSKSWVRPTGEAALAESGTYAATMGFGHEEWLFNFEWILQPVGKSRKKLAGRTIDVKLYTITPDGEWFYAGHLKSCEVLDEEAASAARREFKKRGWLKDMLAQVKHVGGERKGLTDNEAIWVFNVRYKQADAVAYDPMVPVGPKDAIRQLRRYVLVRSEGLKTVERQWATRVGTTELRPTGKQAREAVPAREVDLAHNQLQNELFQLLVKKFGKRAVEMESGFADIRLRRSGAVVLIEVKSDSRPRVAIREALGQLLQYAYVAQQRGEKVTDLIVAGPGELSALDRGFLEHLRKHRRLPIRYLCVRRGLASIDL